MEKTVIKAPELLSPAGNYEKMLSAFRFGADACYLAGRQFGMRTAADNFDGIELKRATDFAHSIGKKIYVTVNILPHGYEYPELEKYIAFLGEIGIDAVIVADLGVVSLVKELAPKLNIHISTQTSITSARAAEQYLKLGAKRVVLARELTLEEIKVLRRETSKELELEAFIHGSMCISWSGRCLLSNHFTGRDANRGSCTQPCRWSYHIYELEEEKRPDERVPIVENDCGTFVMSSKDMCMIEHIPELIEAGIDSFKIEGRMKSAYYTAVTANAYRMAIESYMSGNYEYNSMWLSELESVSHREYDTGFYYDDPMKEAKTVTKGGYVREKAYIGVIDRCENGRAYITQRNKVENGETVEVITPGKPGRAFVLRDMRDAEGNEIPSCPHPLMKFSVKTDFPLNPGDMIRK